MSEEKRSHWYLLTGLLIGLGLGLLYAWVISPTKYVDTSPASLRSDFKDQYRALIASAYLATGDLGRAQARLSLLGDPEPVQTLTLQAEHVLAMGGSTDAAYALAMLAEALKQLPAATPVSPIPASVTPGGTTPATRALTAMPTQTWMPVVTLTPRPTRTPMPTLGAPFVLAEQEDICAVGLAEGLLQVRVYDAARRSLAGAELVITWDGGEEHFFTGLKPELGSGYADFLMTPGVTYRLEMSSAGASPVDLSPPTCASTSGDDYLGGVSLVFRQP